MLVVGNQHRLDDARGRAFGVDVGPDTGAPVTACRLDHAMASHRGVLPATRIDQDDATKLTQGLQGDAQIRELRGTMAAIVLGMPPYVVPGYPPILDCPVLSHAAH